MLQYLTLPLLQFLWADDMQSDQTAACFGIFTFYLGRILLPYVNILLVLL